MKQIILGFIFLIVIIPISNARVCEDITKCKPSFRDCTRNAYLMRVKSANYQMRVTCYEHFKQSINFKLCTENAAGMTGSEEDEMKKTSFSHFIFL